EEAAREHVVAGGVLAVPPPGEVEREFVERALEPVDVALAMTYLLQAVREDGGPGMHGRVDVVEVPLVSGKLTAGMQVPLVEHQGQLVLREFRIYQRKRKRVEGQVPRGVPRKFPLVRHRQD